MSQYYLNTNTNSNNINSFNTTVTNKITVADDRSNIRAWISPLEPRLRHQDVQERRVENVGKWVLRTEEFKSWCVSESDDAVLFCYGDPGVGKTYISSLVIDTLCDQARRQNITVACFYFDFAVQKEQSPTRVLGALLNQVVSGLGEIPGEVVQAYEDQKSAIGGRGPQLVDMVKLLQTTSSGKRTFICIDALDECVEEYRVKLLDSLNQILQKSPDARIFVTGRPHIGAEIGRRLTGRARSVSICPKRDDIMTYLHTRLSEDTNPDAMDSSLEADILKRIPQEVSEIFLLVSLNIDAILQETTIHRRRQKLGSLSDGSGLGGAYGATIGRIKGQGGEKARLGMAALMWISHSERPLNANELCHALAIEIGSPNLNTNNVPSIGMLQSCCQGLVAVDKEASSVRLIHFTLQEYLRAHRELFDKAHSTMAETCLSYLNLRQVKTLSASPSPDLEGTPFLEYSSLYWGVHARKCLSDCANFLALKLFDDCNHISSKILLEAQERHFHPVGFDTLSLFTGLHCASVFGINEIVAGFVEDEGYDVNQKDCLGNTPLVWAAEKGHEGVVKILLGRNDVKPDEPNEDGQTPLCCATENGHEGVVKILLGRDDVNPDQPDEVGQTPLYLAAGNGHERVVKMLLGRGDVNPNRLDEYGQTPLWCAAENGHEGVVEILLGRSDVNPDRPDNNAETPLHRVAWNGHEGMVKLLLRRGDVNPDRADKYGQTPLWCAAENGHEEVVKILLGRDDVNPNRLDEDGRTTLCWAARNGSDGVVKMLLSRDDVNPNEPDAYGQTPLGCAAESGHTRVVKILLGTDNANPDNPGKFGQTPLWCAAENGHERVVKILLARDDVNPDEPDEDGQTPLCCAAENGHEEVVRILLERDDVNPNEADEDGQTPLWCAAENGHEVVVKMLLRQDNVNPNKPDKYGQTPLCRAAWNGREGVVKLLLGRGSISPDRPDEDGRTPLWWAVDNGRQGVANILLGRDDVNPDRPDRYGQTPLCRAAWNGHEGVAKILLERDGVNPEKSNVYGQTPLTCAAWKGHEGVVKLLVERDDVNPSKPDGYGRTPLRCAAENGHWRVAGILLGRSNDNPYTLMTTATGHSVTQYSATTVSRMFHPSTA